jgi:hypothetical protein
MGQFSIQDPQSGKTVTVEGDKAPTQADAEGIFQQAGLRTQPQPQSDNILTSIAKMFAPQTTQAVTQLPGQLSQQAAAREATNPGKGNIINSVENAFGDTADLFKGTLGNPKLWAEDASYTAPIGEIAGIGTNLLSKVAPKAVANVGGKMLANAGVGGLFAAAQPNSTSTQIGESALLNSVLGPILGKSISALSKTPLLAALGTKGPQLSKLTDQAGVPAIHGSLEDVSNALGQLNPIFREQLNKILGKDTADLVVPTAEDITKATTDELSNTADAATQTVTGKTNPAKIGNGEPPMITVDGKQVPNPAFKLIDNPTYNGGIVGDVNATHATEGPTSATMNPPASPQLGDILQQSGKGMTFKEAIPDFGEVTRDLSEQDQKDFNSYLQTQINYLGQKYAPKNTPYDINTDRLPLEAWDNLKGMLQEKAQKFFDKPNPTPFDKQAGQASGILNKSIKKYLTENVSKEDAKAYGDINESKKTAGSISGYIKKGSDVNNLTKGIGRYSPMGLALLPVLTHLGMTPTIAAAAIGMLLGQPKVATNIARAGGSAATQNVISPTISKVLSNMGVNLFGGQ